MLFRLLAVTGAIGQLMGVSGAAASSIRNCGYLTVRPRTNTRSARCESVMSEAASHHASNPTFGRTRGEAGAIITPVQVVEHLADDEVDGNERPLHAR